MVNKYSAISRSRLKHSHLGESSEDVDAVLRRREANVKNLVQATGSKDGRIDYVRSVGSGHKEDAPTRLNSVHFCQKLIDHSAGPAFVPVLRSPWT